jgi:pimeloyl-ACP methyl ester carboxylesterase
MYPAGVATLRARQVATSEGLSLRVIEGGPPNAAPVVLLHGWGASAYSFAEVIDGLVADGRRIVAVDLPGHGLSAPFADASRYTVGAMADAVADALAVAGVTRATVVAHSMGAAVATNLAQRARVSVDGLALIAPVGVGRVPLAALGRALAPEAVLPLVQRSLRRATVAMILRHVAFGTPGRPTERDVDEYWAPTQFPHFARAAHACLHHVDWRPAIGALSAERTPVLMIAGAGDRLVRDVAAGARRVPGARVLEVPDAGHLVMQERATECLEALRAFLTRPG